MLLQVELAISNAKPQNPEESLLQIENMQQIVMAINALSKVFTRSQIYHFILCMLGLVYFFFHDCSVNREMKYV